MPQYPSRLPRCALIGIRGAHQVFFWIPLNNSQIPFHFLIQPGWADSDDEHWQSHWRRRLGDRAEKIEQRDWRLPQLKEWEATARATIERQKAPVVMLTHSLGCILAAKLLAQPLRPVVGAVLVAPADVERPGAPEELLNFTPISRAPLAVPALVVSSSSDPFCSVERAGEFAKAWQADQWQLGDAGHINTAAGFGEWPEGWQYVMDWLKRRMEAGSEQSS